MAGDRQLGQGDRREARRVAVLGAGAFGTAVAATIANRVPTTLWAREPEVAGAINRDHVNQRFLPGCQLPAALVATPDLAAALSGADVVVLAVPSPFLRGVLEQARPFVPADSIILSVSKGIEAASCKRMTEVIAEVLDDHDPSLIAALSGPNFARELMGDQPSATVVAGSAPTITATLQRLLMSDTLRVYTQPDVIGCEIGGAAKNVIAIAAGIADGLGYGWNTKAAMITRGLAELTRLGVALGAEPLTFIGLAGNGDLIATCSSPESRNHSVGEALGRGERLDAILAGMPDIAEGVRTTPGILELARRAGVEMPIAEVVGRVLAGTLAPTDAVAQLMGRAAATELHDLEGRP